VELEEVEVEVGGKRLALNFAEKSPELIYAFPGRSWLSLSLFPI